MYARCFLVEGQPLRECSLVCRDWSDGICARVRRLQVRSTRSFSRPFQTGFHETLGPKCWTLNALQTPQAAPWAPQSVLLPLKAERHGKGGTASLPPCAHLRGPSGEALPGRSLGQCGVGTAGAARLTGLRASLETFRLLAAVRGARLAPPPQGDPCSPPAPPPAVSPRPPFGTSSCTGALTRARFSKERQGGATRARGPWA